MMMILRNRSNAKYCLCETLVTKLFVNNSIELATLAQIFWIYEYLYYITTSLFRVKVFAWGSAVSQHPLAAECCMPDSWSCETTRFCSNESCAITTSENHQHGVFYSEKV